eukprot:6478424-Amphidinium_carterae.1
MPCVHLTPLEPSVVPALPAVPEQGCVALDLLELDRVRASETPTSASAGSENALGIHELSKQL